MRESFDQNQEQPATSNEQAEELIGECNGQDKTEADLLVEWRDALKEQVLNYVESDQFSQDWEIMDKCTPEEIAKRFGKMVNKVFTETPALRELEDTVGKTNLILGLKNPKFPTAVQFGSENELAQEALKQGDGSAALGDYNSRTGKIRIMNEIPECKEIWLDLSYGTMPKTLKTLDHELTHYWHDQEYKNKRLDIKKRSEYSKIMMQEEIYGYIIWAAKNIADLSMRLQRYSIPNKIYSWIIKKRSEFLEQMRDINARTKEDRLYNEIAAQKAGRAHSRESYKTTSLLNALISLYGYDDKSDIDRIILASQAIDRLRALGLPDREITQLFVGARYDPELISIPSVENKIEELAERRGLTLDDLDTMVDLMRVEKEGHMYEAAIIAQAEMAEFASDKKPDDPNDLTDEN